MILDTRSSILETRIKIFTDTRLVRYSMLPNLRILKEFLQKQIMVEIRLFHKIRLIILWILSHFLSKNNTNDKKLLLPTPALKSKKVDDVNICTVTMKRTLRHFMTRHLPKLLQILLAQIIRTISTKIQENHLRTFERPSE